MESFSKFWKIGRWVVLAALAIVVVLMLSTPAPLTRPRSPGEGAEQARRFQVKLQELADAGASGQPAEARLEAGEVNAALAQASGPALAEAQRQAGTDLPPIQTTQVNFHDDVVSGQFTTELYGKNVTVTVSGRLGAKDGYVTFAPTEFKIGEMPVPVSLVEPALQKKLAEAENREKLRLPEFVSDLRIEHGELVVVRR